MTKTSHLAFDVHAATIALGLLDEGQEASVRANASCSRINPQSWPMSAARPTCDSLVATDDSRRVENARRSR